MTGLFRSGLVVLAAMVFVGGCVASGAGRPAVPEASSSGMAKVSKARDLPKYVRLTGKEPEIQVDEPAWVVTYAGRVILPRALGWADDPICVVIDGARTVFLSGRHGRGDLESAPLPVPELPLALPTLAP